MVDKEVLITWTYKIISGRYSFHDTFWTLVKYNFAMNIEKGSFKTLPSLKCKTLCIFALFFLSALSLKQLTEGIQSNTEGMRCHLRMLKFMTMCVCVCV